MNIRARFTSLALGLLAISGAADAAVTMYANQAAYLAATSGNTLVDFEAQATDAGGATWYQSSLTVGNVSFSQPNNRLFVLAGNYFGYNTSGVTSSYLNQNCCAPGGLTINFANPVFAVAMDYGILFDFAGGFDLGISFTLSTGDVISRTPGGVLGNSNRALDFLGFSSTVAIQSITIRNPAEGFAMDNLRFSRNQAGSVPEPGSLLLTGLALTALGLARRRVA